MFAGKEYLSNKFELKKGNLNFAVIGHIEWINFLKVDNLPRPGIISHAAKSFEIPAGGGSVIAKTLNELTNNKVHFFTSLGRDSFGERSYEILQDMGMNLHVAWRDKPTRKGFSLIDKKGERSITVIGERLEPKFNDKLNWDILKDMDGIFVTAGDFNLLKAARASKVLCVTPRFGIDKINQSKIKIDSLIGSNLDPGEFYLEKDLKIKPTFIIKTEGEAGGLCIPGGRYKASELRNKKIDSYGCGDSFSAGILYGLTSDWNIEKSISLAKVLGRNCIESFGPYPEILNLSF
tara:strand:- start:180 stop:1055 length:876 start_codon:yes stop_codon:yes gene_type:complete